MLLLVFMYMHVLYGAAERPSYKFYDDDDDDDD